MPNDFDFEEIDKAVTNAIATDTDTPDDQTSDPPTAPATDTPSVDVPVTHPIPPAVRRSPGRFMDVVHPSSDMRGPSSFTPPQAIAVKPEQLLYEEVMPKPLESPFLADAKVEKRPLGGEPAPVFTLPSQDELLIEAPDELLIEAHALPDPIDFVAHASALPSESEDTGVLDVTPIEDEQPVEGEEIAEPVETPKIPEAPEETEPVGPSSINQQYTEQEPTPPEALGAIFDTEAYHQAVVPVAKKRSGVWVALWIFLLIVLGAGAGVAFYLFILPML